LIQDAVEDVSLGGMAILHEMQKGVGLDAAPLLPVIQARFEGNIGAAVALHEAAVLSELHAAPVSSVEWMLTVLRSQNNDLLLVLAKMIIKFKREWPEDARAALADTIMNEMAAHTEISFGTTQALLVALVSVRDPMELPIDDAILFARFVDVFAVQHDIDMLLALTGMIMRASEMADKGPFAELCRVMGENEAIFVEYLEVCPPSTVNLVSGLLEICTEGARLR
jgi:hypothetical protein